MNKTDYTYHDIDLRTANQNDLALALKLSCVLVSGDPESKTDERVLGLYSFAELHNLNDLLDQLNVIYSFS